MARGHGRRKSAPSLVGSRAVSLIVAGIGVSLLLSVAHWGYRRAVQKEQSAELSIAASKGDVERVRLLLERGIDPDSLDDSPEKTAALIRACGADKDVAWELVDALLEAGADVNVLGPGRTTALMYATYMGNAEVARALVSAGASLSATDVNGHTAAHWAARAGQLEIVRMLKMAGADFGVHDRVYDTPRDLAKRNRREDVLKWLESVGVKT